VNFGEILTNYTLRGNVVRTNFGAASWNGTLWWL